MKNLTWALVLILFHSHAFALTMQCTSGNCTSGAGKVEFSDGSWYLGAFQGGALSGFGVFRDVSGVESTGLFKNGKMNGEGTTHWPDGDRYIGNYVNGGREGYGTFYDKTGKIIQQGQWAAGKLMKPDSVAKTIATPVQTADPGNKVKELTHFLGIKYGDTKDKVDALFGKPTSSQEGNLFGTKVINWSYPGIMISTYKDSQKVFNICVLKDTGAEILKASGHNDLHLDYGNKTKNEIVQLLGPYRPNTPDVPAYSIKADNGDLIVLLVAPASSGECAPQIGWFRPEIFNEFSK